MTEQKSHQTMRILSRLFEGLTGLAVVIIILMLVLIFGNITYEGWRNVTWTFLSQSPTEGMTAGGIFPCIFGTMALVLLMTIMAIPLGVFTAVYLTEYAGQNSRLTKLVRLAVNNLAGVPSIVFGLFGLGFFVYFIGSNIDHHILGLGKDASPLWGQPSIIWASMTMALLTLPVVIVTTEEALKTIPREIREASYALGATRWQTIYKIVLPQALPGIFTGGILAVSRGAGEVAPILILGAAYYLPHLPTKPTDQFMALGYHVYILATQSPDVELTKPILYGTVLVLLLLTFALNFIAIFIRSRLRKKLRAS